TLSGRPVPAVAAEEALGSGLVHVVIDETARGAERAEAAWRSSPSGRSLVEGRDLSRLPDGFGEQVAAEIRAWQGDVLAMVRAEGADRRTKARVLSLGVNAVGVALMVVVFTSTAFIPTGLEVGAGAATAVVGQKLLETIFGDEAVRRMARTARERLTSRLDALLPERSAPFEELLDELSDQDAGAAAVVGQKLLETIFGDEAARRMARTARERLTSRLDALIAERSAPFEELLDELGDEDAGADLTADAAALTGLARTIREDG